MNIRRTLEEGGYEPEYEPEQEPEQSPEIEPKNEPESQPEQELLNKPETEPENQPEHEPLNEPETEPETQPEQEPEKEWVLINPETGEPVPHQPDPEFIPLEDYIEQLHEQQESPDEVPDIESEQESEVIPEQETEIIPEQQQRKAQKKKHIKAKKLELIADPKELGDYKHYEYQHIIKTKYDPIFSQKQIRKPQKRPVKIPKQVQKKKPEKVKKIERITDPKELGEYKHYEYSHTLKKPSKQEQAPKKSEKSEKKSEISQKTEKKSKPEEIKELELIADPIETEKSKEVHESKTDSSSEQAQSPTKKASEKQEVVKSTEISKEKANEITEQEPQTQRQAQQSVKTKKQEKIKIKQKIEPVSSELLELQERYRQETGKRPIYDKRKTNGFKEWLERQKKIALKKSESAKKSESREGWELLLEKWIIEAKENEISKEIKEELLKIIRKYRKGRAIYWRINQILERKDLAKKETEEIERLLKKLEKMTGVQVEIFKNLRAFKVFYNENLRWYKPRIMAEREKFIKYLAQKLKNLKKIEKTQKIVKKNWKEILKENLYKNITLSLKEKSIINKILQKEQLTEGDIKELISILSKLPTEELISLLGNDFRQHIQNYLRWGWDFDQGVKRIILNKFLINEGENEIIMNLYQEKIVNNNYSTLEMIEDLRNEIAKHSDILSKIFHNKFIFPMSWLSLLWNFNKDYVKNIRNRACKDPNKRISERNLNYLKLVLIEKYGFRSYSSYRLISDYQKQKLSTVEFIDRLLIELGKYSGDIRFITDRMLSIILIGSVGYISKNVIDRITNSERKDYNTEYKPSLERLKLFEERLEVFLGEKAEKSKEIIVQFKKANLDLKLHINSLYTIENPLYFHKMDTIYGQNLIIIKLNLVRSIFILHLL